MDNSNINIKKYVQRLQRVKVVMMREYPFYAVLLSKLKLALDEYALTAYTNGELIAFSPEFMDEISDDELSFILMHETLHVVLNHCNRRIDDMDILTYNKACDIVVNSIILYSYGMDISKITLQKYGESMHIAPDGKEGYEHTVDEVYYQIISSIGSKGNDTSNSDGDSQSNGSSNPRDDGNNSSNSDGDSQSNDSSNSSDEENGQFDDHSFWSNDGYRLEEQKQKQNLIMAKKIQTEFEEQRGQEEGTLPLLLAKQIDGYVESQTDWRVILENFIQEDIVDYSFNPPDKRMQDSPFIFPDFNEKEEVVNNVWFCVDTSGSIDDDALRAALSEIKGAIDQFNGHLSAYISFFDSALTSPIKFESIEDYQSIKPEGGGGTSFKIIFDNLDKYFQNEYPTCIVILTDGYALFPNYKDSKDIPVLWLINNEKITPPWGKIARIKIDGKINN